MMEVWTDEKGKRVEIKTLFGYVPYLATCMLTRKWKS